MCSNELLPLIRYYWGVCKPLVGEYFFVFVSYAAFYRIINSNSSLNSAAAAVHNLCEWGIVLSISTNYKELEKYLSMAAFFITFLVTLCICVPDLYLSLGLEQSFGIMLDFGMPIMFTLQLLDNEKRKIYLLPAIAHTGK